MTTHNGAYAHDGAGRLVQVVDSATGLTELYTWNNDGTLASAPGSGYTKRFGYDEESRLTSISHDAALAYQYAYGADGGRRWRKDIAANLWTWYPCGQRLTGAGHQHAPLPRPGAGTDGALLLTSKGAAAVTSGGFITLAATLSSTHNTTLVRTLRYGSQVPLHE